MQRAAGCCWSVSSLDVGGVPPAPIPQPCAVPRNVRVLLGPLWERQGSPERLHLGEKGSFFKAVERG